MSPRDVNLHPASHHPSALKSRTYDVIFLGAGPVANLGAARLASTGLAVLVTEASLYGGDCPYWACVPSKALLRPIDALASARAVGGSREKVASGIDVDAVFARRDAFVNNWDDGFLAGLAEKNGAIIARGWARLEGKKMVSLKPHDEDKSYSFEAKHAIVLATGSVPVIPKIPGLETLEEGTELWGPAHATSANYVPGHLIILGTGAVGIESATTYIGLGGKVTVVSSGANVLSGFEPQASERVKKSLEAQGVRFYFSSTASSVRRTGSGTIVLNLTGGASIQGTTLLIAAGRQARTADLGLESIPYLTLGAKGAVPTSASLAVDTGDEEPWLYAVGDTNGRNATTHSGSYHSRIASNAILAQLKASLPADQLSALKIPSSRLLNTAIETEPHAIPRTIFSHPGVASVGHTLASAKAAGIEARQVAVEFQFPGALLWADGDAGQGWACWVIDGEERLIGATYVASQVEELLMPATLAVSRRLELKDLVGVVPCFPTRGEVWRFLLDAAGY